MDNIDLLEFGWQYELIIFMLTVVVAVDAVGIIRSLKAGIGEMKEYAQLCIKYLKIIMTLFAGAFFIYAGAVNVQYDMATRVIHFVLGALLLADTAVCLFIKIKYRRVTEKDK